MAIAFNLPSEREASEENFSRLNRLLTELYEVLCHILVSRQPGPETQDVRRDRPFSDSEIDRLTQELPPNHRPTSASIPPPLIFEDDLEDDVFVSPRGDNGNDPFSTSNMDIFGLGSPRTPAGVLLSPRRDRRFSFSAAKERNMRDKGGTEVGADETDTPSEHEASSSKDSDSDSSIFSSILTDKLSGSICTAVIFMLGWKLLSNKR